MRVFIRGNAMSKVNKQLESLANMYDHCTNIVESLLLSSKIAKKEVSCIVIGNMLSPIMQKQSQLATAISSRAGFENIANFTVDGASASGANAINLGYLAIKSGVHKNVVVLGVEQMLQSQYSIKENREKVTQSLAQASDWETEGSKGKTFISLNDTLMTEYIKRYPEVDPNDFFYFSENAHENGLLNEYSLLKKKITLEDYLNAPKLVKSQSVNLFDSCSICNGYAGVLLSSEGSIGEHPVLLSSVQSSQNIQLSHRKDILELAALRDSVNRCFLETALSHQDIDIFEVHDAYSIMAALCLEVTGFCDPGRSLTFAKEGNIKLDGELPIATFGGLKARGHPVGATGVYQIVESCLQIMNKADDNQVRKKVKNILTTSFGGAASNVITNIISI